MEKQYKNILYLGAGITLGLFLLNSSFASQIYSNLAKGFIAITASDEKKENNLVGLDAGGKLPIDIIPANALGTTFTNGLLFHRIQYFSDERFVNCPNGFQEVARINANENGYIYAISKLIDKTGPYYISDMVGYDGCRWWDGYNNGVEVSVWGRFYDDIDRRWCSKITICYKY